MSYNSDRKYTLLNPGNNRRGVVPWKKLLLFIAFVNALAYIILTHKLECLKRLSENQSEFDKPCIYYPPNKNYGLKLIPEKYTPPLEVLQNGDYNRLIDFNDFTFTVNQENKCSDYVFLLLLISSAPRNKQRRDAIRAMWGKEDNSVKRIFLLGSINDNDIQETIRWENELYGDIVQGNFMDSYRNLTYKTVMALKFGVYHCPNAVYTLKLDDDIFVNMPLMKNYLKNDLSPFGATHMLQCIVLRDKQPMRYNTSKWYVPKEVYSAPYYPTYCQGPYVLLSPDALFKLYKESQQLRYFHLEDVFTYGLAASRVEGLNHSSLYHLTLGGYPPSRIKEGFFDQLNFLFGTLDMTISDIENFWHYVVNRPVRSSVYDFSELSDF